MRTSCRFAALAAAALVVLGPGAGTGRAGYFPPSPVLTPYYGYNYSTYSYYNTNPLAFNPAYVAPSLYFRPSTAGPIYGVGPNFSTPTFNSYGLYSTYTYG